MPLLQSRESINHSGPAGAPGLESPGRRTDWIVAKEIMGFQPGPLSQTPPQYSTNLEDAWRVVERIETLILQHGIRDMQLFSLESYGEGEYIADFGKYWWARQGTAAFAICCAACEAMQTIRERSGI